MESFSVNIPMMLLETEVPRKSCDAGDRWNHNSRIKKEVDRLEKDFRTKI